MHFCGGWDDIALYAGLAVTFVGGLVRPVRDCVKCAAVIAFRKVVGK